ncbi:MAG: hypothetical protein CXR31_03290 [Geobacter sp.]|nr:MAG: hypothetical protein CXR31_03290 [Geobacter sp.]
MNKIFVLDTNVLLSDPKVLDMFRENTVLIPMTVIEEIDRFKNDVNQTGNNAREVARRIDALRRVGSLADGVQLENGGSLRVAIYEERAMKLLPPELREERGDNRILALAVDAKERNPDLPVIFVTKDTNLRIKADALGLVVEDYESDEVEYTAYSNIFGPDSGGYIVVDLADEKRPFFHDLLRGFEEYATLKGYAISFSIDSSLPNKIAFKFTLRDTTNTERLGKDFQEYVEKIVKGDDFSDMPVITSPEEHLMLFRVLKNRISFLQHSYDMSKNAAEFYENLAKKAVTMMPMTPALPSQNIVLQTGGVVDSRSYNANNSSRVIQGDSSMIIEKSTIKIGCTFSEKKAQLDKILTAIQLLKNDTDETDLKVQAVTNLEKVKDELENESHPDESRISKWLERTKQAIQLGSFAHETVSACKELLEAFGIG